MHAECGVEGTDIGNNQKKFTTKATKDITKAHDENPLWHFEKYFERLSG